jgi:hypothetical protein
MVKELTSSRMETNT